MANREGNSLLVSEPSLDSSDHTDENQTSGPGIRKCSACHMPTKGHHGPVGPTKCFYGLLLSLSARVDELERLDRAKTQQLEEMEKLGLERQTALLANISSLEDTVAKLQDRLVLVESSRHRVPETSPVAAVVTSRSPAPSKASPSPPSSQSELRSPPPDNPKKGLSPDPSSPQASLPDGGCLIRSPPTSASSGPREPRSTGAPSTSYAQACKTTSSPAPHSDAKTDHDWKTIQRKKPLGKLVGAARIRKQVFYVGGIGPECASDDLRNFLSDRCQVLQCRLLSSWRCGTQSAYVVVPASAAEAFQNTEWPDHVYVRRWNFDDKKTNNPSDGSATPQ